MRRAATSLLWRCSPHFMDGACTANRGHLIHYMKRAGVRLFNCARVTGFGDNSVEIVRNVSGGCAGPL